MIFWYKNNLFTAIIQLLSTALYSAAVWHDTHYTCSVPQEKEHTGHLDIMGHMKQRKVYRNISSCTHSGDI